MSCRAKWPIAISVCKRDNTSDMTLPPREGILYIVHLHRAPGAYERIAEMSRYIELGRNYCLVRR